MNHGLHFVEMHNLTRDGWKAFISVKDNVNLTFTRLKDKLAQASNNTFVEYKRESHHNTAILCQSPKSLVIKGTS